MDFVSADKDDFCKYYKAALRRPDSEKFAVGLLDIIVRLNHAIKEQRAVIAVISRRENEAKENLNMQEAANEGEKKHLVYEIAGKLIDICNSDYQSAIRDYLETYIVTELIGGKDYLIYKLEHDYPLTAEDKEALREYLNEN